VQPDRTNNPIRTVVADFFQFTFPSSLTQVNVNLTIQK
jgi:hypothetical protein